MIVQLCKKGIDRLGAGTKPLVDALRDAEHTVVIKDCLDRCIGCDKGLLIASAGGMPISAANPAKLLTIVAELAEDE